MTVPEPEERRLTVPRSARYRMLGGGGPYREVWIVLHGFGQLAEGFIRWFLPALAPGRLIVAPEALNRYYTDHTTRKVGATWMTSEDRLAEIADYVRYLDLVVAELQSSVPMAGARFEVHGFSQGSATACRWATMGQVRPRRLVLWGGGVPPDLDLAQHGAALTAARLTLVLGDRDEFISEDQVTAESRRLGDAGVEFELLRFRGGHTVPAQVLARMAGAMPNAESAR